MNRCTGRAVSVASLAANCSAIVAVPVADTGKGKIVPDGQSVSDAREGARKKGNAKDNHHHHQDIKNNMKTQIKRGPGRPKIDPAQKKIMRGFAIHPDLLRRAQQSGINISAAACRGIENAIKNCK